LFLAQNRIASIQPNISSSIPNLATLVLTKNRIAELADLEPLAGFKKLVYLSLIGNPVASKEVRRALVTHESMASDGWQNYRYWLIFLLPTVRFLDFAKVRAAERAKAAELFGTADEPTALTTKIMGQKSKGVVVPTFSTNGDDEGHKQRIWTDEERKKMRAAIQAASSLAEIAKLEKDFAEGRMPAHLMEDVEMGDA